MDTKEYENLLEFVGFHFTLINENEFRVELTNLSDPTTPEYAYTLELPEGELPQKEKEFNGLVASVVTILDKFKTKEEYIDWWSGRKPLTHDQFMLLDRIYEQVQEQRKWLRTLINKEKEKELYEYIERH